MVVYIWGFPGSAGGEESTRQSWRGRVAGLIPGLGRPPGVREDNPLQYSCLENPADTRAWWATVHRVTESDTLEPLSPESSVYPDSTHTCVLLLFKIYKCTTGEEKKKNKNGKQGKISDLSTGQMLGKMEKIPSFGSLLTSPVSCRLNRYNFPRKPCMPGPCVPMALRPCPVAEKSKHQAKPLHCSSAHADAQYTECILFLVTFLFLVVSTFYQKQ